MEGRGFVKARARTAGDRIRVTPLNAKARGPAGLACARLLRLAQACVHVDVESGRVAHPRQRACVCFARPPCWPRLAGE